MLDFHNQNILVTGAAGNVGSAIARRLSQLGASLILSDMREAPLADAADTLSSDVAPLLIAGPDLRTPEGCKRLADQALLRFGRIDGLANTIGTFKMLGVMEGAAQDWSFLMDLNALSALRLSEAVLPSMTAQRYGRIVNVAAGAGEKAFAGGSVYAASKAAVMRITEAVSEEHKHHGVNANCVMPGTIDTPENRAAMPTANFSTWVQPEEIASVVVFLLSTSASAVTGAAIPIAGRQ